MTSVFKETGRIEYDLLLVGGSPSNLALAHRLVDLAKESGQSFTMAILEKGAEFGQHIMSGAVVKPKMIEALFPDHKEKGFPIEAVCNESFVSVWGDQNVWNVPRFLLPEGFKKEGAYILTLSHVVYWMASQLKEKLKEVPHVTVDFFNGFAAHEVLFEGHRVTGVRVVAQSTGNAEEDNVYAKVTCFGDKGFVSQDVIKHFNLRENPQSWSVGVKEVWQLDENQPSLEGKVWHTMGFPLVDHTFGGGFIYGMKDKKLTVGLVMSLNTPNPNLNPQQRLQDYKKHPWLQEKLKGAKLLKYGAALLPEGGYYSLPKAFAVNGGILLGDALGVLNVSTLAGVDKAFKCGLEAANVLHACLKSGDFSAEAMAPYQKTITDSFVVQELYEGRYFRHAWEENPRLLDKYMPTVLKGIDGPGAIAGMLQVGLTNNPVTALTDALRLKAMMDGKADFGSLRMKKDYEHIVPNYKMPRPWVINETTTQKILDKETIYSREDAVFYANPKYHEGNEHIDEFNATTCQNCISKYDALGKEVPCVSDCTAEVHRVDILGDLRKHGMSLENCVQCRTCEIVCPEENLRVYAAAQGSGPDFTGL